MASTPASIRRMKDPVKRASVSAEMLAAVHSETDETRAARDAACLYLLRNKGWQPVQVYRLASLSRRLFGPIAGRIRAGEKAPFVKDAPAVAEAAGQAFWTLKRRGDELTEIRIGAIEQLLAQGWSNAAIARTAGVSGARVAQIRSGE